MNSWGAYLLMAFGVFTAVISGFVAYKNFRDLVFVDWRFFAAMSFGSLAIALFYLHITNVDEVTGVTILLSRLLFGFVLLTTCLMSIGALLVKRVKRRDK